jgi:hypothetical protein
MPYTLGIFNPGSSFTGLSMWQVFFAGTCIGTELVPETLYSNELTRLCAREDYIESCRREIFKTYIRHLHAL